MSKPFYADYVNHMLRFYSRHDNTLKQLNSHDYEVEKLNYTAVDSVLSRSKDHEKELIISIYTTDEPLNHTVTTTCSKLCITTEEAWKIISRITKAVARERRLI